MAEHHLTPTVETLHGAFSPDRAPVLRVQPGDTIIASTLDAGWGLEPPHRDGTRRRRFDPLPPPDQGGHCLIGPVYIDGAQPGMTLVVHIEAVIPGDFGFSGGGGFEHRVNEALGIASGAEETLVWSLDADTMTGVDQFGHRVALRPFLGIIGMPPPEPGFHPTPPPRIWGGNIDCKDLVAGTRLYLPVPVAGGLLSFGDGHARQGHGEVGVMAIECPMRHVRLGIELDNTLKTTTPCAWTPDGWLTFGFHADLEQATYIALEEMLSLMMSHYHIPSKKQALALATAVVDLHITQIANPVMGVHALLPHGAIT